MKRCAQIVLFLTLSLIFRAFVPQFTQAQTIYKIEADDAFFMFFDPQLSQYMPHITRMYQRGKALHNQIWNSDTLTFKYIPQKPVMYITDWEDDGNAGVSALPTTTIGIGMAPLNYSFFIAPSVERYSHLFSHEYTHVVMADKYNATDLGWRKFLGTKVSVDSRYPISAFWSYFSVPRWYSARWCHEGIACFMETWFGGGVGRALGGYDEMYFRSIVNEHDKLFSVVGLETEGTTQDFQVGTNAYLYGTRFVNYLALQYGIDSLFRFYNRTPDSKRFFANQFKNVYGKPLRKVWEEWKEYEELHQKDNLAAIEEYPVTNVEAIAEKPLGSISCPLYDERNKTLYAAVNYPGTFAHVVSIDVATGKRKKLMLVDGSMLYQTAYLALDKNRGRLFITAHNGGIRGLRIYDLKGNLIEKKEYQRVSNIVYDNARDRLYGIFSNAGVSHIVWYDKDLTKMHILYSIPFGKSISDLDVSHDGTKLSVTIFGNGGEQILALFNVADLENAIFSYENVLTVDDTNLSMFRFSQDDASLIGSSYYTGVSNLWSIDLSTKEFNLLSNTENGLFAPVEISRDSLLALEFKRDGMIPVKLKKEVIHDANAIDMLGQKAFNRNPQLAHISELRDSSVMDIPFADVYNKIEKYNSFKELRFAGAYPDISGFTDTSSFNNVTPVLGYRFMFQDKIGINRLNFSIGASPWSHNDWKHKIHASLNWQIWGWTLDAYYNSVNFYDLLGPFRSSRKGYKVGLSYKRQNTLLFPFKWDWGAGVATYGGMDKLPLFQDIEVDEGITSLQTAYAEIGASKMRTSLGGVMPEQGYKTSLQLSTYFAGGKFYPSAVWQFDTGFLIPFARNTSFWLRSAVGHSFGDLSSAFGNDYFGGFRNNYVDCKDAYRYREVNAMPGARIDQIAAHSYAKFMGELNFKPIRFNNFGFLGLYPTYAQISLFSTDLITNPWGAGVFGNYVNAGAQINIEVVLFSYLKTTWSVGYAHIFKTHGLPEVFPSGGEWLFSLKLL